jgi:glycosyltransferase involved in cell wall biosynthesis
MKLLIVTQVMDEKHPALGFFVRWVREFAQHCEKVTVLCLEMGEYSLPENVEVVSLGKDSGVGKVGLFLNLLRKSILFRKDYDSVFAHMNPVYVVAGGLCWRLLGKKVGLWYTHGTVSTMLKTAVTFSHIAFTASENSLRLNSKKKTVVGHGVDVKLFQPMNLSKVYDLIVVGRISRAKNLHALLAILQTLNTTTKTKLLIVGAPLTSEHEKYKSELEEQIKTAGLRDVVEFYGPVTQRQLPELLNKSKVFATTAENGSLDKVILEAMACGLPLVSMAEGSNVLPLGSAQVATAEDFVTEVSKVLKSGNYYREDFVSYIKDTHSLSVLIKNITNHYV